MQGNDPGHGKDMAYLGELRYVEIPGGLDMLPLQSIRDDCAFAKCFVGKNMKYGKPSGRNRLTWQDGVVLPLTLIVLVAMTLAGIALLRSVDTSSVIAGNLAFRQSATVSGDMGVEAAISWLKNGGADLTVDSPQNGYYASRQDKLDLTGNLTTDTGDNLNWDKASEAKTLAKDSAGNVVAYVIHRMCDAEGDLDPANCAVEQSVRGGSSLGGARQMLTYHPGAWDEVADRGYYRITARITGPRNTTSYIQVVVVI
jgi:Tfp pilus assembly protein PilX